MELEDWNYKDYLESIMINAGVEIIYAILNGVFLVKLKRLNDELIDLGLTNNSLNLIKYNNWEPMKYFAATFILFAIGLIIIWLRLGRIKYKETFEKIENVIGIIIVIAIIALLVIFINNPILKAVMTIGSITTLLAWAMTKS